MSVRITGLRPASPVLLRTRPRALAAVGVARVLGRFGPKRMRRVLENLRRGARPATEEETARALDAVLAVSARMGGEWCLERAIACAVACRLVGSWPEWCTGVRLQPFQAHAWVAVNGRPVGENPHTIAYFSVVWSVPPPTSENSGTHRVD